MAILYLMYIRILHKSAVRRREIMADITERNDGQIMKINTIRNWVVSH